MGGIEQSPVSRMTPIDLPRSATYRPARPLGRRRSSFWNVVLLLVDDAIRRLGMVTGSLALGASRYLPVSRMSGWSAGGASDVGRHDVRGVAVQGHPGPVVTHRGPWVGMAGGLLHVAQWHPSIEGCGDECVAQRMRTDWLGDLRTAGDPPNDPAGPVTVKTPTVRRDEDRTAVPLAPLRTLGHGPAGGADQCRMPFRLRTITATDCRTHRCHQN